jgi:hypothetical protein
VPHGNTEAKAAVAAAKAAAKAAATAETSVAATAAMTPQANEAGATVGEVAAAADGSAATPAEAATASTSHLLARCSLNIFDILFHIFSFSPKCVALCAQKENNLLYIVTVSRKP